MNGDLKEVMDYLDEIVNKIKNLKKPNKTLLVAIDGRGGSGKSTLAENLKNRLEDVTIVPLDDFAYPIGNADRQRLLDQVIIPLKGDTLVKYQKRDFETKELTTWHEIKPGGIVIIEGVITLHDLLEKYYDFKIWIECPAEVGFQRGFKRDKEEYGVDTEKDWKEKWMPEEDKAIAEQKPQEKADYIIDAIKDTGAEPSYQEFYNPSLVAIYNTICPLDGYEKLYFKLAKELSAETIVDIGCGTGLLTSELAKQGYNIIGVEPSRLMLDVARKSPYGEKVKWIEGDALSLGDFNADLAIMTGHVAQFHLENEIWEKALKSIYKVLRPGGYLAFESRNPAIQPWTSNKEHRKLAGVTDWYAPDFRKKYIDPVAGEIEVWIDVVEVKDNKVTTDMHYLFTKTGEELLSRNTLIFRTKEEITKSLEETGFIVEKVYGNWDGSLATEDSPEFIFVARREL